MYRWTGKFFCLLCVISFAQPATAALLYVDPPQQEMNRGDAVLYQVRVDTDEANDECINAVSGVLQFAGPIEPIDISDGSSIISLWVEQPTIVADKKQVTFTGGIPNGYCGRVEGDPNLTNVLFEVVVRADPVEVRESEVATIALTEETAVTQNDPYGTAASVSVLPSTITVLPTFGEFVSDPWTEEVSDDVLPPQEFSIILEQDASTFGGQYYIAFNTTDKQTGIAYYEVIEEPLAESRLFLWGRADAPWVQARSPYPLADQSLNSVVRVKAVDKAGNEYIATLIPDESLRTDVEYSVLYYLLGGSLLLLLVVVLLVVMVQIRAGRVRRAVHQTTIDNTVQNPERQPTPDGGTSVTYTDHDS